MANSMQGDANRSHGDKLDSLTGNRGQSPEERAARIAGVKVSAAAQGDSGKPEEVWTSAPARQISNSGNVRK